MLQVEILSGGEVTEQLEVDGNKVYSESGELPDFMKASVGRLRGGSLEERVQRMIDGAGNQLSLNKGNGARLFEGNGNFASHAPEKTEPTAEDSKPEQDKRTKRGDRKPAAETATEKEAETSETPESEG